MKISCYGSRGSISVSGKDYLKYGGDTTCITVTSKNGDLIIIDAGTGIRKLGNELIEQEIKNFSMIFTHAHFDHLCGFPFFKPLYSDQFNIDLYGCPFATDKTIKDMIAGTMNPPHFPVDINAINAKIKYNTVKYSPFSVGTINVIPIQLSHPGQGIGYKFVEDDKVFVFLTDNELGYRHKGGLAFKDYVHECKNVDLLIHDAEYDEQEYQFKKTWGHSTYNDATKLALEANVKRFGLFHHNQDRADNEIDTIVNASQDIVNNANSSLECIGISSGYQIEL
jgi:phosphoribosyl 1,2-cyclic phosphodiesterase